MKAVLLATLLLSSICAFAADNVVFTQLVHRHGSRSPIVSANSSLICNDGGFGCGELNLEGRDMLTQLGGLIRNRYPEQYVETSYNWSKVYSRSTAKNRTIQSSDSMLRGLFPNTTDFYPVIFGQELADDMLLLSDNWASISLRLSTHDLYNADILTAKRMELFPDDNISQAIVEELHIEGFAETMGMNYGLLLAQDIATCYMATGTILNGNYPTTNAHQTQLDALLFTFNTFRFAYNRSVDHWAASGSPAIELATKLVDNMKAVISGDELHFMIEYSAHDTTLAPLASTLGALGEMTPVFGKMYLFELVKRGTAYFVRALAGQPQQNPSTHQYTTYYLPLSGLPTDGTLKDIYVVSNDTGVALDDFYNYILSTAGTSGQGMCYIGDDAFERIGCNVLDAPAKGSDCYKYRHECPNYGCPSGSYMSDWTTFECTLIPVSKPSQNFTPAESTGIGIACTALGVVIGAVSMFFAGRAFGNKPTYEPLQ